MIYRIIHKGIRYSLTFAKIKIPEIDEGDSLSKNGKYSAASLRYTSALEILSSANMRYYRDATINEQVLNEDYIETFIKLWSCQFLTKKHASLQQKIEMLKDIRTNDNDRYTAFISFLYWSTIHTFGLKPVERPVSSIKLDKEVNDIVSNLLVGNSENLQKERQYKYQLLFEISESLNNRFDYRKGLKSLVERSPKTIKSEKISDPISKVLDSNIHKEIQIVYFLKCIILNNPFLNSSDKQGINNRVNQILKFYESSRPQQVYKPLINTVASLIGQNHYMSAEGMVGYLKTEEIGLLNGYESQDRNLISNLYRMLVTRANNQKYEEGWEKQKQVKFGTLVVERIMLAPLIGHPIDNLFC